MNQFDDAVSGWDATQYWQYSNIVKDIVCDITGICNPSSNFSAPDDPIRTIIDIVTGRTGLMPVICGIVMVIFPATTTTIHILFALLDVVVCIFIFDVLKRLGAPYWIAFIGAVLQATYIPTITGSATLLQQPFIRFSIMLVLWSYTRVLTSQKYWRLWIVLATLSVTISAFSVLTLRPLLWIVIITVIIVTVFTKQTRHIAIFQSISAVALIGLMGTIAFLLSSKYPDSSWFVKLTTGWSNEVQGIVTTPISFPQFWPPNNYWYISPPLYSSISEALKSSPYQFIHWLSYSIFANWYYPDYLYFQEFILTIEQQKIQHWIIMLGAIPGIAWLLGKRGAEQKITIVMLGISAYICSIYGIISVEPRRYTALVPILMIGVAGSIWSVTSTKKGVSGSRNFYLLLVFTILLWILPLSVVLELTSLAPSWAYVALIIVRILFTSIFAIWVVFLWANRFAHFQKLLPISFLITLILFIGYNSPMTRWREWNIETSNQVRQEVAGISSKSELWPWLIVDFQGTADSIAIYANGKLIKEASAPMYRWSPEQSRFSPMTSVHQFSNFDVEERSWLAVPLPRDILQTTNLSVEIQPVDGSVTFRGDYMDNPAGPYNGPSLEPWNAKLSFWQWQWNGNDPRIYWDQSLDGQLYTSSFLENNIWQKDDLSPMLGNQSGVLRIFVIQVPFGVPTNVIISPGSRITPDTSTSARCIENEGRLVYIGSDLPYICRNTDKSITYYTAEGEIIGTSQPEVFSTTIIQPMMAHEVKSMRDSLERVELFRVDTLMFIANVYDSRGNLTGSIGFDYLP